MFSAHPLRLRRFAILLGFAVGTANTSLAQTFNAGTVTGPTFNWPGGAMSVSVSCSGQEVFLGAIPSPWNTTSIYTGDPVLQLLNSSNTVVASYTVSGSVNDWFDGSVRNGTANFNVGAGTYTLRGANGSKHSYVSGDGYSGYRLSFSSIPTPPPPPGVTHNLTLTFSGNGQGSVTVTSNGSSQTYRAGSTLVFNAGTSVQLVATEDPTYVWKGFSGAVQSDYSGKSRTLTMDGAKSVNAQFDQASPGNVAPVIAWTSTAATVSSGESYAIAAHATDEGNLDAITLTKTINGVSSTTTGSNSIYSGDVSATASHTGPATITWVATATDAAGASASISLTVTVNPPAPVDAQISASPQSTNAPGASTLSWSSSNASSVSVTGPNGFSSTSPSGNQSVSNLSAGDYTYTIVAQGYSGPVTKSVTVHVAASNSVTANISASPTSSGAPGSTTISWGSSYATSVSVSGPSLSSTQTSGSQTLTGLAAGTYTYTIVAQGAGGPATQSATFTVSSAAPGVSAAITASPTNTTSPGSTTVNWSTQNASSVSVSGPGMSPSTLASGSQSITGLAAGTYTYTVTAQGNNGPATRSATVTVAASGSGSGGGALVASLSADPSSTYAPGIVTLVWGTTNATAVTVSGPNLTTDTSLGAVKIIYNLPLGTHTYTLVAQGTGGPLTRTATVTVTAAPPSVTASISANPGETTQPGAATINWTSANATSVLVSGPGMVDSTVKNGSANVSGLSEGEYTYTITAEGTGGPAVSNTTLYVAPPPPPPAVTASLDLSKPTIEPTSGPEGTTVLIWTASNSNSYTVSSGTPGFTTKTGVSGTGNCTLSGLPPGWYTFVIHASGATGTAVQSVTLCVKSPVSAWMGQTSAWGGLSDYTDLDWTSLNATSVLVTGPGISSALSTMPNAPGRVRVNVSQMGGYGVYTWRIVAQGVGGPVTDSVQFYVRGSGRSLFYITSSPDPVPWTGSVVTFSGKSSIAGSGHISIWRSPDYETLTWDEVDSDPETGEPIYGWRSHRNYAGGSATLVATIPTSFPNGTGVFTTWQQPASQTAASGERTGRTYYFARAAGTDSFGGGPEECSWSQDPAPAVTAQTVTVSPATITAAPGSTVTLNASGGHTGYVWAWSYTIAGAETSNSGSTGAAQAISIPIILPAGTVISVSAYSPAGAASNVNWGQSNTARATITVAKSTPTITWPNPAPITYGTALSGTQLNATANTPGTFAYSPASGAVPAAGSTTLRTTFTPTDSAGWHGTTASVPLTINKAALTVTANNQSRVFGAANPALTLSYSGFVNGDTAGSLTSQPTASTIATPASQVGTYPIAVSGGSSANYTLTHVSGALTITPATVTFTAGDVSAIYDGNAKPVMVTPSDPAATYTITYAGTGTTTYSSTSTAPTNAGTYSYTATANGNYAGSGTGTLTILRATPVIAWPAPTAITYGTALSSTQLSATANVPGSFSYSPAAGTVLPYGAQSLSVTFTPTDSANYSNANGSNTIAVYKATLTVIANNQSRIFGAPNPVLTLSFAGFVNGDTTTALTSAPTASTTATVASAVGTYPIVSAGGAAANYSFNYVNGTLTVTAKPVTFSFGALNQTYNGMQRAATVAPSDSSATYTVSYAGAGGTVYAPSATPPIGAGTYNVSAAATGNYSGNGSSLLMVARATPSITWAAPTPITYGTALSGIQLNASSPVAGTFVYAPTAGTVLASGAQTLSVTLTATDTANYTSASATTILTVNKAALTARVDNQTKVYGAAVPSLTVSYSGFVNGDTVDAIETDPTLSTTATAASAVGTYPITLTGATAANYVVTPINGTLTVTRATLVVRADDKNRLFADPNPPLTYSVSGFVNGDTAAVLNGAPSLITPAAPGSEPGTYPITVSPGSLAAANYGFESWDALLQVLARPISFTFSNLNHVYDGTQKTAVVVPSVPSASYMAVLNGGPDAGSYTVTATASHGYKGTGTATLVITPAPQTVSLTPPTQTVFAGQPATVTASGGANGYVWQGDGITGSSGGSVSLNFATPGTYHVSASSVASTNYLASTPATAAITVVANRVVTNFTPVESSFTVTDAASPMNGQSYGRIWRDDGWVAYLGRAGVRFAIDAQAWPSVKTVEIQAKSPGGSWTMLATNTPSTVSSSASLTFSVMLGEAAPGEPLVPLSFQQGNPQTGTWQFRARVQDSNSGWSDFSPEIPVNVILPVTTKTLSGQTVPPAGDLGAWFTASPVQRYTFPLWIP